jgi:hypothetical protein
MGTPTLPRVTADGGLTNTAIADAKPFACPDAYARHICMSKRHVQRLMRRGILPFIKMGHRSILIPIAEADASLMTLAVGGNRNEASAA